MKKISLLLLTLLITTMCNTKPKETMILIQTEYGNIKVKLYNETPLHRDNFIKLAETGFFNDKIFHRVINNFMIQGGELGTKTNSDSAVFDNKNTIEAEFRFPQYFHKRGALAAARWGDSENPTKASDAHQFYIVTGEICTDNKLQSIEKQRFERLKQTIFAQLQSANMDTIKALYKEGNRLAIGELRNQMIAEAEKEAKTREVEILYTDEQKEIYKTKGGTPHLDGEYTVFGEVVEGMDVVDKIQNVKTNEKDKPLQAVRMKVSIIK